jgi:hypothetical protein
MARSHALAYFGYASHALKQRITSSFCFIAQTGNALEFPMTHDDWLEYLVMMDLQVIDTSFGDFF